jgi:hypothetical protein
MGQINIIHATNYGLSSINTNKIILFNYRALCYFGGSRRSQVINAFDIKYNKKEYL